MTETLRTKQQLLDQFLDNQTQSITPEMLRDFVISVLGVGTGEAEEGATPTQINTGIGSGLERLGNRRFRVLAGGDGTYFFVAIGQGDIDIEANVNVAIVKNDIASGDGAPNFILKRRMYPGAKNEASNFIIICDLHSVVENDIIELQFQEGGGANVSNTDYIYLGFRIG